MSYDLPKLREIALLLENDGAFYQAYELREASSLERRNCIRFAIKRLSSDLPFGSTSLSAEHREQLRRYFDNRWNLSLNGGDENRLDYLATIDIHTDTSEDPQPKRVDEVADYSKLPDGALLKLRNGSIFTKGRAPWLDESHQLGKAALMGFNTCTGTKGWQGWKADGGCYRDPNSTIYGESPFDVVGVADAPETQPDHQVTTTEENLMDAIIEITTKTLVNGKDVADFKDAEVYALIAAQENKVKELEAIQNKPKRLVVEIEKRQAGIAALVAYLDSKE